jgi:hypothetical protein
LFIWYVLLWRVSRLPLRLNPLHADHAGGLGFLEISATAISPVLVAQSTFFATVLGDRVWHQGAKLTDFKAESLACVALLMLFALVPLTFFVKQLNSAHRRGIREYGWFASRYANAFAEKWLAHDPSSGEPLLGTSDIQSLADLANSFAVVQQMRSVPFGKRLVLQLLLLVALPILALTLSMLPFEKLLSALFRIFV